MRRLVLTSLLAAPLAAGILIACVGEDKTPATIAPQAPDGSSQAPPPNDRRVDGGAANPNDAGGDADATTYDVGALPGLKLWLESASNVDAPALEGLRSWADHSNNWGDAGDPAAPDGGRHRAVPIEANPPGYDRNGFGGRPTFTFVADGSGRLGIDLHPDFVLGTGDFFVAVVAAVTAGNGPLWNYSPSASAGQELMFFTDRLCVVKGVPNGCTTDSFTVSISPHVFVARREGGIFSLRIDGVEKTTLDRRSEPVDIEVSPFDLSPFVKISQSDTSMQYSEVLLVVGPTSDAELSKVETHLLGKYGID